MKKYFIVSNIVLIIAVIILFCMQFGKSTSTVQQEPATPEQNGSALKAQKIAYLEMDSIDDSYKFMQDAKDALIKKNKSVEDQINDLRAEVQSKINEATQKGPTLSQAEQMSYNKQIEELSKKNQEKAQRLGQSLSMERDMQLQKVRQRIQEYLKQFAHARGYSYIVALNENDNFYYKDSTLDVTKEVLKALNASYEKEGKDKSK